MTTDERKPLALRQMEELTQVAWKAWQTVETRVVETRAAADRARVTWEEAFITREIALQRWETAQREAIVQEVLALREELGRVLEELRVQTNRVRELEGLQELRQEGQG
jgi:hypothetical protein